MLTKRRPLRVNGPFGPLTVARTPLLHQPNCRLPRPAPSLSPPPLSLALHLHKSFPLLPHSSTLPPAAVRHLPKSPFFTRPCHSAGFSMTILLRPRFRQLPLLSPSTTTP